MSKEYIEKKAAIKAAQEGADIWDGGRNYSRDAEIQYSINKVPAADVKPVVRGRLLFRAGYYWEEDGTDYSDLCVYINGYCFECGRVLCRVCEKFCTPIRSGIIDPNLLRLKMSCWRRR